MCAMKKIPELRVDSDPEDISNKLIRERPFWGVKFEYKRRSHVVI